MISKYSLFGLWYWTSCFQEVYMSAVYYNSYITNSLFFYCIFALLICLFATFLILLNNPIYSVISLILVYLAASFLLVFVEVHFLAVLFILVYLGAVVVLFLFIVMMLNIKVMQPLNVLNFIPFLLTLTVFGIFLIEYDVNFKSSFPFLLNLNDSELNDLNFKEFPTFFGFTPIYFNIYTIEGLNYKFEHFNVLAFLLYTHFFIELLIASYVLLLAMVGCIALTLGIESKKLKKQDTMQQMLHSNSFLLRIVN